MNPASILIGYLLCINIISLLTMRADKKRAIMHKYRIAESTLWLLAAAGGSIGAVIGMQMFRHKTKHVSFVLGFPLLAAVHLYLLYLWIK
ncbi:DUF1294 domain-containing protein [Peribacillus kribbensis]|uniref:DUF1294 domain-containing protein n=1 Tax=Peribacillus kribbensis TaxID=356658 RepID=UPI0024814686|nr:DUF1294 domain-containing protein [Peribacillus kribbensis]